ncbi:DUF7344 domain-containing protein [Natrinema caseinilyticum]|uniref:DUF7344 domain-containing protein n=1 Tax=Natrinema caseinilyticum TaxID=2961570 RepID=UPI0020C47726|nr:hypothetical protein [Natrinema caseinilyticum]
MSYARSHSLESATVHALLSNETRRGTLRRLNAVERTTTRDLVRYLVSDHRAVEVGEHVDPRALTIRLIHDHLPRLADHGVVDYEDPDGEIRPGPTFGDVAPFVAPLERTERR